MFENYESTTCANCGLEWKFSGVPSTHCEKCGAEAVYDKTSHMVGKTMPLPTYVETVMEVLENAGFKAYVVGGCVRDWILGNTPKDYDVATNALPEEVKLAFCRFNVVETGLKHGTVTVVIDDYNIEVTTYRVDGIYTDGRRPDDVQFTSSLEEDLSRRDFTMNAMAYSFQTGLVDPFDGEWDCRHRIIKCVGDPIARFNEDPLRMLRAIRFDVTFHFFLEKETMAALKANFHRVADVSIERQVAEFTKMLMCDENGLVSLSNGFRDEMKSLSFIGSFRYLDNWRLQQVSCLPKDLAMRLAAFFRMKKPTKEKIETRLREMRLSNDIIKEVLAIREAVARKMLYKFRNGQLAPAYIYETIHKVGLSATLKGIALEEIVEGYRGIFTNDYHSNLVAFIDAILVGKPCINICDLNCDVTDVMYWGYRDKQVGEVLNYLLRCVWHNQSLNNYIALMTIAFSIVFLYILICKTFNSHRGLCLFSQ